MYMNATNICQPVVIKPPPPPKKEKDNTMT